jgi:polysaccharide export outer membrane protein
MKKVSRVDGFVKGLVTRVMAIAVFCGALPVGAYAEQARSAAPASHSVSAATTETVVPARFIIGVGDVLAITFWRDEKMSGDVVVRPDGMVSLPLLNDVPVAGKTPEQVARVLIEAANKFMKESPEVTVIVREIHSRRVFVLGKVASPGKYDLVGDTNVLQILAMAGGLLEYADTKNIVIIRTANGQEQRLRFNYNDALKGKNVKQNVVLQPGDTIVVR